MLKDKVRRPEQNRTQKQTSAYTGDMFMKRVIAGSEKSELFQLILLGYKCLMKKRKFTP